MGAKQTVTKEGDEKSGGELARRGRTLGAGRKGNVEGETIYFSGHGKKKLAMTQGRNCTLESAEVKKKEESAGFVTLKRKRRK